MSASIDINYDIFLPHVLTLAFRAKTALIPSHSKMHRVIEAYRCALFGRGHRSVCRGSFSRIAQ